MPVDIECEFSQILRLSNVTQSETKAPNAAATKPVLQHLDCQLLCKLFFNHLVNLSMLDPVAERNHDSWK